MEPYKLFFELFESLPRQGPGLDRETEKAFQFIPELPSKPRILDLGCGKGMQSLKLAALTKGEIIAVDIHEPFLASLDEEAKQRGIEDQIRTLNENMLEFPFPEDSFDMVWAEGALYNFGFRRGLEKAKNWVVPGGYIAVTEGVWFRENPPAPIWEYWDLEYSKMMGVEANIELIKSLDLNLLGHFSLPPQAWTEHFYDPLEKALASARDQYGKEEEVLELIENLEYEIRMFRRYNAFYGYEFFVMQKPL